MKIDLFETHDRYQHFMKQDFSIEECCQNLIDQDPFLGNPFYIFAHPRTDDDGIRKRLVWQPRLTRPEPQTNSMLFKAYPRKDEIKIIWMIPAKEMWPQYQRGMVAESGMVTQSIYDFKNNIQKLRQPEADDLTDIEINLVYTEIQKLAQIKRAKEAASLASLAAQPQSPLIH